MAHTHVYTGVLKSCCTMTHTYTHHTNTHVTLTHVTHTPVYTGVLKSCCTMTHAHTHDTHTLVRHTHMTHTHVYTGVLKSCCTMIWLFSPSIFFAAVLIKVNLNQGLRVGGRGREGAGGGSVARSGLRKEARD